MHIKKQSLSLALCISLFACTFAPSIWANDDAEQDQQQAYNYDNDDFETIHIKKELAPVFDYGRATLYIVLSIALKKCIDQLGNPATFSNKVLFFGLQTSMIFATLSSVLSAGKPLVSSIKAFGNSLFQKP